MELETKRIPQSACGILCSVADVCVTVRIRLVIWSEGLFVNSGISTRVLLSRIHPRYKIAICNHIADMPICNPWYCITLFIKFLWNIWRMDEKELYLGPFTLWYEAYTLKGLLVSHSMNINLMYFADDDTSAICISCEIPYLFPKIKGAAVDIWEWINDFIPHIVTNVIILIHARIYVNPC